MSLAVVAFSRSVTVSWVSERETHQKELQKIMGVPHIVYTMAWLTFFLINGLMNCIIMCTILTIFVFDGVVGNSSIESGFNVGNIYLLYFLMCTATIGFTLIFCSFFSDAKTASQGMTFFQVIISCLYFLRFVNVINDGNIYLMLLSIFPQNAFNFGVTSIAFQEKDIRAANFSYNDGLVMLGIETVVYLILAIYMDLVIPNSLGNQKHPLFFLPCLFSSNKKDLQ